jgi:hypothetical protein
VLIRALDFVTDFLLYNLVCCASHASFYVASAAELVQSLQLTPQDLPAVFMVSNEEEGILKYVGEILELNLSEWVLKNSSPAMGELTVSNSAGRCSCSTRWNCN